MKIIIAGMGKIGSAIAESLVTEGHDLVAIDTNPEMLVRISEELDISSVAGSCTNSSVLEEAEVAESDLLIAVTANDEVNLLCCLIAKKMGVGSTICRVRDPEYTSTIDTIRGDMGLSMVVNPEREAAAEISRIIENPFAQNVESFMNGRAKLMSFEVSSGSPLEGVTVAQMFSKIKAPVLVCAVERDQQAHIPFGSFQFASGDVVTVICRAGGFVPFLSALGLVSSKIKDVIVVGGGTTAYYLADMLLDRKTNVSIIEKDAARAQEMALKLPKADVINADGTDYNLLMEEGIDTADALCCLTGIDEENVLTTLFAKTNCPGIKTITKINRSDIERTARPFDLGSVISLRSITANLVLQYVRAMQNSIGSNVITLHRICQGKVEALEFKVNPGSRVTGIPLEKLPIRDDILIACINRDERVFMPRGNDTIEEGDTVIIVTTVSGLNELDDIRSDS
ncbi:MAG: Trk system potassium transporter TrkA [Eubacteriaceae bacterium]|nr:Trk system potassium transporter TrkA [Eubacteriaceae bacterium]